MRCSSVQGTNGALNPIRIVLLFSKSFMDYSNHTSLNTIVYNVSFCSIAFASIVS